MSRAYRVAIQGSVERIVHVDDGVCTSLELLPILPRERMREHLGQELSRRGFEQRDGVARRAMEDGVTVEVALETGTVTVRVELEATVKAQSDQAAALTERPSPEQIAEAKAKLQVRLDAALEAEAGAQAERARRQATKLLEAKLGDLRAELDGVVNRVTAEALKEKARQMGEIEEMVEDAETGSLTITVKL
jgi:hypothetical protein